MTRRNTPYLNFVMLILLFASCANDVSTNASTTLSGTWIFTTINVSSNKAGYAPNDNRYAKYKYLDLYQNGKGVLWGGKENLNGIATWDEKNKWIELQAKDSSAVTLDFEKYSIDSARIDYLHVFNTTFFHDTALTREIYFKK